MAHKEKESLSAILESLLIGLVESIFAEMLAEGGPSRIPKSDAVMEELNKRFASLLGPPKKSDSAGHHIELMRLPKYGALKKAHHRAVDLIYDALAPAKRGAPSYPPELIEELRKLKAQGKSYGDLAKRLSLPTTPGDAFSRSKDSVRKLIKRNPPKTTRPKSSPPRKQK